MKRLDTGPVAGGALVAATGASTGAFVVDAASFGISALTLLLIPRSPASRTEAGEQAPSGGVLALLRRSRALQVVLVVVIAANLASGGMGEIALPAVSGVLVRHLGPVPFFPAAGALVAAAIVFGLTRREFRAFGARGEAEPQVTAQAAEGSRK